jgi:hypothetical protein
MPNVYGWHPRQNDDALTPVHDPSPPIVDEAVFGVVGVPTRTCSGVVAAAADVVAPPVVDSIRINGHLLLP